MASLSRRTFLVTAGAVGAGIVLAACGSDDGSSTLPSAEGGSSPSGTGSADRPSRVLVRFSVDGLLAVGKPQRTAVGIADADGLLLTDTPPQLTAQLVSEKGAIGSPLTVDRHNKGLPRPYYPFITEITEVGTYGLVATVDGVEVNTKFSIVEPSAVPIPQPGDQMVPVATPTVADAQGVNPICTREPACDLHQVALTDALKQGKPVAFLIATPAYCQTAACGPVLDVLLGQESEFGSKVQMVHAEVYTDSSLANTTQAVHDYRLSFEPVLYLAGADGVIRTRLDSIFDETELHEALTALVS